MVELATVEDFQAIADLNIRCYQEYAAALPPGAWKEMQQNLQNVAERAVRTDQSALARSQFLIIRSGRQIVGSVAYCPAGNGDPAIFTADMASILLLAVDPCHRGNGMGKRLMIACIDQARIDRANAVGLFTSELMQTAQRLYHSLGFELVSELPSRHGLKYYRYVLVLNY